QDILYSSFVTVCAIGWIELDEETRVERLYTPQHTKTFNDRDWVEERFGDDPDAALYYLNRRGSETSVLSKEALLEVFDLYDLVMTISAESQERGFDERSCEKVYWRREGVELASPTTTCQKESILAFWDYNRTKLVEDPDVLTTINREDKVDCCSRSYEYVSLDSVVGKFRYEDPTDPSKVTGAGALSNTFFLETHLNRKSRLDPHTYRLMRKFSDKLLDRRSLTYFERPMPATAYDFDQSYNDAWDNDQVFVTYAIIIIIVYAFVATYSPRSRERSRGLLGLGAVLTVILSTVESQSLCVFLNCMSVLAAAFGIAIGLNVPFSPSTTVAFRVAIFLVLGIGLDDSFVIMGAVEDRLDDDPSISPLDSDARQVIASSATVEDVTAKRIVHTLASAGPSITVTSLTDAAAFIAGSFVDIPDIAAFNRFCAVSVLVDYAMQLTFFVALFTLDQRRRLREKVEEIKRREAGAPDPSCCSCLVSCCCATRWAKNRIKRNAGDRAEDHVEDIKANEAEARDVVTDYSNKKSSVDQAASDNPEIYFWGTTYANTLLSPVGRIFVLSSFIALLVLAIVGTLQIEMDIEDYWGVVTNPALRAFNFEKKHFGSTTQTVGVYTKRTNYYENREAFYGMLDDYAGLNFVVRSSLDSNWYSAYDAWLNETNQTNSNYDEWLEKLETFLSTDEGVDYSQKVVFDDSLGVVATHVDSSWETEGIFGGDGMRRMRKARKKVRGTPLGTVIVYQQYFVWNESFNTILRTTVRAIAGASVTILVILILILGNIVAAFMVACAVAFVCISTLGALYWFNDELNYITSFFIIIAVGLSADAPAHVMHAYLDSRASTRRERARVALEKLGPSVFKGGISTITGVVITGGCITYIFLSFFRYLMTILVLALFNGLAVMPVVCSLIGPMPTHNLFGNYQSGHDT
ncbi:hypothetical protein CTAYLR_008988, partial [Chrysophaeum taylorii]